MLFIGATDSGEIEAKSGNLDKLQKTLSEKKCKPYIHPSLAPPSTLKEDHRECIAVIVPGSPAKPHFGGPLYVREFSKSVKATAAQFESLLATSDQQSLRTPEMDRKQITVREYQRYQSAGYDIRETLWSAAVIAYSQFYLTINYNNRNCSLPLATSELAYDHQQDCLQIERSVPLISTGQTYDYRQKRTTLGLATRGDGESHGL